MWKEILETQIIGIIVGAVITSVTGALIVYWLDAKKLKKSYLLDQIQKLYAPLHFFVLQNELYLKLNEKYMKAYQEEYGNKKWNSDKETVEFLDKETQQIFNKANEYNQVIRANNEKICELMRNNYGYIDWDDFKMFHQFVVDRTRDKMEFSDGRGLAVPLIIYSHLGDVFIMRTEFIDRVKEKFNSKKRILEGKR